jgi:hypothetical protein
MIFKEPGDIVTTGNILAIRRTPGQTGSIAWLPAAYPLAG